MSKNIDVMVKRLDRPIKSFYRMNIDDNIEDILERGYVPFSKTSDYFLVGNKIPDKDFITEQDLQKGIVIIPRKNIHQKVPSQYDIPYNKITNQCSWVSKNFVENKDKIYQCVQENNMEKLSEIYLKCLTKGTEERQDKGKLPQGENLDELDTKYHLKNCIYGNPIILQFLDPSIISMIVKPNTKDTLWKDFIESIHKMKNGTMMILNRDGQTFCFQKISFYEYLILDSHRREFFTVTFKELKSYILQNNDDGYYYILYDLIH